MTGKAMSIREIAALVSLTEGTWVKRRNVRKKLIKQSNDELSRKIREIKDEIRTLKAGGAKEQELRELYSKITKLELIKI